MLDWVANADIDWRDRSDNIAVGLRNNFEDCAEGRKIKGSRDNLELDANILINERRVAIEVEVSNNIDNGIYTLRHAIAEKISDCGVLIVPWSARRSGQANEGKATGRIDREFDKTTNKKFGPVYRLAVVRELDVWLRV